MHYRGKWFAGLMIGLLGGCFASYGYNDFDGEGAGGTGGVGAVAGSNSSGSSSSSSSGTGGNCPIRICGEPTNSTCNQDAPCMQLAWAHRFGLGETTQAARDVAVDNDNNVIIAGNYTWKGFNFRDDNMDGGPSVPDTSTPSMTQGYVARLNSSGIVEFAREFVGETIQAVAVASNKDIVVAGANGNNAMLKKVHETMDATCSAPPCIKFPKEIVGGVGIIASAKAVALDGGDNIYVVGQNVGMAGNVPCNSANANIPIGMFVIKYDIDLACQWIRSFDAENTLDFTPTAITAKNALESGGGIWITGGFNGKLVAGDATYDANDGSPDMFLIKIDPSNMNMGATIKSFRYGNAMGSNGVLKPFAIEAGSAGRVYVAGEVKGKTSFHASLFYDGQPGVFVAMVDGSNAPRDTVFLMESTAPRGGATGIALIGDNLYMSGTFAGSMSIDPSLSVPVSSNVNGQPTSSPFLASLSASTLQLLTFDVFGGGGDTFDSSTVHLAAFNGAAVLAGAWTKALDFSTMPGDLGTLSEFPDAMQAAPNPDIFVAKFTP
jgi:hypothetical protein